MAELADAPDLGSGGAILVGSSPSPGTIAALPRPKGRAEAAMARRKVYLTPRVCLTGEMGRPPSNRGLTISVGGCSNHDRFKGALTALV